MTARLTFALIQQSNDPVTDVIKNRIEVEKEGLLKDIDIWLPIFTDDPLIEHHLTQFRIFVEDMLENKHQAMINAMVEPDRTKFRLSITNTMKAQWFVLRQTAQQRLPGSPYTEDIDVYEKMAKEYYYRLFFSLPTSIQEKLTSSSPLIYIGRSRGVAIFEQQGMPPIINVPINIIEGEERSIGALAHEAGHAVFSRIKGLEKELNDKVRQEFKDRNQDDLLNFILGWLDEMVADCTGTALEGLKHAESAIWMTAPLIGCSDMGSETHPPFAVRTYSHLAMLNFMAKKLPGNNYDAHASQLEKKMNIICPDLALYQFVLPQKVFPIITLADVSVLMTEILEYILNDCKLSILAGKTLGELLINSVSMNRRRALPAPIDWGKAIQDMGDEFEFELPGIIFEYFGLRIPQGIINALGLWSY